jgi:hypothetical protein
MKRILISMCWLWAVCACTTGTDADGEKKPSPYMETEAKIGQTSVSVKYSSPRKKGREIWGHLVPYGEVWRTGADEATVFETTGTLRFGQDTLAAGKYSLFTIPQADGWTLIFNREWDQWGAFAYDEAQDALRIPAFPNRLPAAPAENFTILLLEETDSTAEIKLVWDNLQVVAGFSAMPPAGR